MSKRSVSELCRTTFFLSILLTVVILLTSCAMRAPGETVSEVKRRRKISGETNILHLQDDIDAVMLIDRPSRLNDKYSR